MYPRVIMGVNGKGDRRSGTWHATATACRARPAMRPSRWYKACRAGPAGARIRTKKRYVRDA